MSKKYKCYKCALRRIMVIQIYQPNEFNILYIILFKHLPIPMLLLCLKGIFYRGGSDFNVREG